MQDFIVLGIIPGTNIQIDFSDWLLICASIVLTYVLVSYVARKSAPLSLAFPTVENTNTSLIGPIDIEAATV